MKKRRYSTTFTEEEIKNMKMLSAYLGKPVNQSITQVVNEKLKELKEDEE